MDARCDIIIASPPRFSFSSFGGRALGGGSRSATSAWWLRGAGGLPDVGTRLVARPVAKSIVHASLSIVGPGRGPLPPGLLGSSAKPLLPPPEALAAVAHAAGEPAATVAPPTAEALRVLLLAQRLVDALSGSAVEAGAVGLPSPPRKSRRSPAAAPESIV